MSTLPFHSMLLWHKGASNNWYLSLHKLGNGFKITLLAAKVRLANLVFSFSAGSSSHLTTAPQFQCMDKRRAGATYSIDGPTRSAPIRAPCKITLLAGRFIPAARLQVATITLMIPSSYAIAIRSRSSVVRPASMIISDPSECQQRDYLRWKATPTRIIFSRI